MRKLIVSNAMSLDGYYEGPGKNVMALFDYRSDYPTDESFDAYNAERLRAADTLLLGRTSYDGFKGFWPSVADDPNATPLQREISRLNNAIDKVVISDSMTSEETNPWHNTRIISRADAHEQLAELKRQPGRERSWFLVAEHCGSTDNLTNTLIIRIRVDHREITLV
jgi:dihydrofolate reductase